MLPLAVKAGPRGGALTFSFGSRGKLTLIDELGEALLRLAQTVPHGVVVFVPSFQYEAQLVARWQLGGLWARLNAVKPLFREPRAAAELEPLLKEYAATIRGDAADDGRSVGGTGGAMLLSVVSGAMPATTTAASATRPAALLVARPLALTPHPHARPRARTRTPPLSTLARRLAPTHPAHPTQVGGKMSEGINFSDELARCVVMVGLPYANPTDLTLQERMAYVEGAQGAGAGREYYTNLCMKAVNQSIGRAIRHIGDYATVILADARFAKPAVRRKWTFLAHTAFIWVMYYLMAYVVFSGIDALDALTAPQALFVMMAGGFGMVLPSPGGIGSYQLAVQYAFIALGFGPVLGLATANVVWAAQTGMIITTGGIGYLFLLAAGLKKAPKSQDPRSE